MSTAINIRISPEMSKRIETGPLAVTGGMGKSAWVKGLILKELDRLDGYGDGSVQARELAAYMAAQKPPDKDLVNAYKRDLADVEIGGEI